MFMFKAFIYHHLSRDDINGHLSCMYCYIVGKLKKNLKNHQYTAKFDIYVLFFLSHTLHFVNTTCVIQLVIYNEVLNIYNVQIGSYYTMCFAYSYQ